MCRGALLQDFPAPFVLGFPCGRLDEEALLGCVVSSDGRVRSGGCAGLLQRGEGACSACAAVLQLAQVPLRKMAATATGPPGFLGHGYLTLAQCRESLAVKVAAADAARLRLLSYATQRSHEESRRGVWVTVQRLLAEKDLPRLRLVLQQLLARNARPSTVLQRLEDAAAGLRLPKGGWSQAEWDLSELLRDLGGARAAHALQQVSGAPSLSELQRHSSSARVLVTYAPADLERHVIANLRAGQLVPCQGKTAWVVAWDSVTLRVRVAFDGTQGQLAGLCYFHMGSAKDVARCAALDHVHKMHARVASGEVHPAVEALIVSVFSTSPGPNDAAIPVAVVGSCTRQTAEEEKAVMDTVMRVWCRGMAEAGGTQTFEQAFGRLLVRATDGATTRRQALERHYRPHVPCSELRLASLVVGCAGAVVCMPGADIPRYDDLSGTCELNDLLHLLKRLRSSLLRKKGMMVSPARIH